MYIDNRLFHICCFSWPIATWWKARKYFKFPDISINFFITFDFNKCEKEMPDWFVFKIHRFFNKYFYITRNYHSPYANVDNCGNIFDFSMADVMWTHKEMHPRHDMNGYIYFCLFKLFGFNIIFHKKYVNAECEERDGSMEYYEYMLEYLYFNKDLRHNNCWEYESQIYKKINYKDDKEEPYKMIIPTPSFSLNKNGRKAFRKLYNLK